MNEQELREQICLIGQLMHQKNFIDGGSGNISARLDRDRILATPSGLAKGFMLPDQLITVDLDGNRVGPITPENAHLQPTSELLMHLECYMQRDDIQGVVHAHPPTAVALTIAGYDFARCLIPEVVVLLGIIPTTPYATPSGGENRDAIRDLIREHDAILLAYHGSLTVSDTIWKAYLRLESLEHSARILYKVQMLGGPKSPISPHQVEKLLALREKLGLAHPGDAERFYASCGVMPQGATTPPADVERQVRAIIREVLSDLDVQVLLQP